MKLAAKLMLVFLTAVAGVSALFCFWTVRGELRRFRDEHERFAHSFYRTHEGEMLEAWRSGGLPALRSRLTQWEIRQVRIRYVSFKEERPGAASPPSPPQLAAATSRGPMRTVVTRQQNGERHIHVYYPVRLDRQDVGGLEISKSMGPVQDQVRQTIRTAILSFVCVVAVCSVVMLMAGVRMVARPLRRLTEKAERIGRGDFSGPLTLSGRDELQQLAGAMNVMCTQLLEQQERIRQETASRQATVQQLRHADRLKTVGRLAAGIAHEMGTPLNVISGRAGMIASGRLAAEDVARSATAIKAEADRITTIVRNLLDFARQTTPQRRPLTLRKIVDQTAALLAPLAHKRNVTVEVAAPEADLVAPVDEGQMQQVLTNVLVNAIQASPEGERVTASLVREHATPPGGGLAGEFAVIRVSDRGPGIPPGDREQIFEPFFTTKGVGEGTGLGLSIAYGIVQEHGGWIDVHSRPGDGSLFAIHVPLEPA
jgi:signal transduction histidine kinase